MTKMGLKIGQKWPILGLFSSKISGFLRSKLVGEVSVFGEITANFDKVVKSGRISDFSREMSKND